MIPLPHFLWWAAAYRLTPKPYRRLMDNGCQIGNHTHDHKILTRVGKKEVQKQVSKTNRAVKK